MTNSGSRTRVRNTVIYSSAFLLLVVVIALLIVGTNELRRARHLRDDICKLEPGKSTFADVSAIFPKYQGFVLLHDDIPSACLPEGCDYLLIVENPISRLISMLPRTALCGKVQISENTLRARSILIVESNGQHYREAFVQQSLNSHFSEDMHVITRSKMPAKGVAVRSENSAGFVELANGLRLGCLMIPGICSEPDDMLPFLAKNSSD